MISLFKKNSKEETLNIKLFKNNCRDEFERNKIVKRFYNYKCKVCGYIISKQVSYYQDLIPMSKSTTWFKIHRCPNLENELDHSIFELLSVTVDPIKNYDQIIYLKEENKE